MRPLFRINKENYLGIPCRSYIEYDGDLFPESVRSILSENRGDVIFGGSSLIHDLYFREERWERDYDIWCNQKAYMKLKIDFLRNENYRKLKEEIFTSNSSELYYSNFKTKGLCEYMIDDIKIQLINIGERLDVRKIVENIDFTFNTIFYDGLKLIFFDTSEEEIKSKQGNFRFKYYGKFLTSLDIYELKLKEKEASRIQKYKKRGFNINNLCPFCGKINYLNHCYICIFRRLSINLNKDVLTTGKGITDIQKEGLIKLMNEYPREDIIYCCLMGILSTGDYELFENQFELRRDIMNVYSDNFYVILDYLGENGYYRYFKKFFDLVEPFLVEYSYEKINDIFKCAGRRNYLNVVKLISSRLPRFRYEIFEDKIVKYKFLSIFECYFEIKDLKIILDNLSFIKECKDETEEICGICHTNFPNLSLICNHRFCENCLLTYFSMNKHKLSCPMCRRKFNYKIKIHTCVQFFHHYQQNLRQHYRL